MFKLKSWLRRWASKGRPFPARKDLARNAEEGVTGSSVRLPPEILLIILEYAVEPPPYDFPHIVGTDRLADSHERWRELALVSRDWRNASYTLLFEHVALMWEIPEALMLVRTFDEGPSLAPLVFSFESSWVPHSAREARRRTCRRRRPGDGWGQLSLEQSTLPMDAFLSLLSKFTNLRNLVLHSFPLVSSEITPSFQNVLSNLDHLQLHLSSGSFLLSILPFSPNLSKLEFTRDYSFSLPDSESPQVYEKANLPLILTPLQHLYLTDNLNSEVILSLLPRLHHLKSLRISHCITSAVLDQLSSVCGPSLQSLFVTLPYVTPYEMVRSLGSFLQSCTRLAHLFVVDDHKRLIPRDVLTKLPPSIVRVHLTANQPSSELEVFEILHLVPQHVIQSLETLVIHYPYTMVDLDNVNGPPFDLARSWGVDYQLSLDQIPFLALEHWREFINKNK